MVLEGRQCIVKIISRQMLINHPRCVHKFDFFKFFCLHKLHLINRLKTNMGLSPVAYLEVR